MEEDYKTTDLGSSNEQYRGVPYQSEYMTQPINPFASSQSFSTEWNRKFTRSALEAKQDEEQSKIGTLITQGYLPEIYKDMTLPPAMLNDLWNKFEQDQAYKAGQPQFVQGRSDEELAADRWRRQLTVRQNQQNDAFTLNMNNFRWSDRFAYEHPDMVEKASRNNQITAGIINAALGTRAAGPLLKGLATIGQAFIPSTWLEGIMGYFGYTVPQWLSTGVDLAASAYFAKQAGDEFDRNGFTPYTAINGALSLIPMTRSAEGVSAVSNGLRNLTENGKGAVKVVAEAVEGMLPKGLTVSKAINQGVKDTKLVNMPVEHVTSNGVTTGLKSYSDSDVGFHLSPEGSPTTTAIQESTGMPYVRRGTWTYSDNTKPKVVTDNGNWTYDFSPELYSGTNPGKTNWENAIALDSKGPNFAYKNNFEGNGEVSYMTTSPEFGLSLSKNAELPKEVPTIAHNPMKPYNSFEDYMTNFSEELPRTVTDLDGTKSEVTQYYGDIGEKDFKISKVIPEGKEPVYFIYPDYRSSEALNKVFEGPMNEQELLNKLKQLHSEAISKMNPLQRYLYLNQDLAKSTKLMIEDLNKQGADIDNVLNSYKDEEFTNVAKDYTQQAIEDIYYHPDYQDRFQEAVRTDDPSLDADELWEKFQNGVNKVQEEYTPIMSIPGSNSVRGQTISFVNGFKPPIITLNPRKFPRSGTSTPLHEFGHGMYDQRYKESFKFIKDHNERVIGNPEDHLITPMAQLNSREQKRVKYFINPKNQYDEFRQQLFTTVDEAIKNEWTAEQAYEQSSNMKEFKKYFQKDYLIGVIAKLLAMIPVVSAISNNDN